MCAIDFVRRDRKTGQPARVGLLLGKMMKISVEDYLRDDLVNALNLLAATKFAPDERMFWVSHPFFELLSDELTRKLEKLVGEEKCREMLSIDSMSDESKVTICHAIISLTGTNDLTQPEVIDRISAPLVFSDRLKAEIRSLLKTT
ncbi:hypothetical protein [uncultured Jannaschia sp.]|uniref:hypothetical protein n=1 Tax=uncultured Jannaschia sp. TaxID=293347 RepID=UPI00261BFF8B|nr:hypothetical protein [uncultured Jannaschia sp.]